MGEQPSERPQSEARTVASDAAAASSAAAPAHEPGRDPERGPDPPVTEEPLSSMTRRFNLFFRWFARRFFRHIEIDPHTVARLRELEASGTVVYVMRYASRLDYFLFNWLFLRQRLRLSSFANGIRFFYYRPLWQALRIGLRRWRERRSLLPEGVHQEELRTVSNLVREGRSFFLFLRTSRRALRPRRAVRSRQSELDFLQETVRTVWDRDHPVYLVPLALFWRKGPRAERRFLNLAYGSPQRPTDFAKVTSFLTTYRGLYVKAGEPIELHEFIGRRRAEGVDTLARKIRRSIMIFLYREEKVVVGPTLRSRLRVQDEVMSSPDMQAAISRRASERGVSHPVAHAEAEKMFREIAANMNSTFFAILNVIVTPLFNRIFSGIEVSGIEKVADYAKNHPIVLVPSHRSYFDFLILTWLFYHNHMMPPHIAARENMGFGPFGFIFRRAGAFFLRKSFDAPLFKEVFRQYVAFLVGEGFTQEFFIEGGRSRTGKMLTPRLGMLTWDVESFLDSTRRDLFFVPIAITYERLVEEGAMVEEQEGAAKQDESMLGLMRARKVLSRRFGSVTVAFGEPISLAQALGPRREFLAGDRNDVQEAELRGFVDQLGHRIVERINWATVANATSVASCVLLGEGHRGILRHEFTERMGQVVELLALQDAHTTAALERDVGEFQEAIAFLLRSDLVKSIEDSRGEILFFEDGRRRALELYRNSILHFLVAPSFLARGLLRGMTMRELAADLSFWLDLFYREFFVPQGELMAAHREAFVDHFDRLGAVQREGDRLCASEKGGAYFRFLSEQTRGVIEAYCASLAAAAELHQPTDRATLEKAASEQFDRGALLGELSRPEASNPVTFANALDLLVRRGMLERETVQAPRERRPTVLYRPGPAFDDLGSLRAKLAAALAGR